jgi:hypothetical protein
MSPDPTDALGAHYRCGVPYRQAVSCFKKMTMVRADLLRPTEPKVRSQTRSSGADFDAA